MITRFIDRFMFWRRRDDKPNQFERWFCERFLDHVPYPLEKAAGLRDLNHEGVIAYVHRSQSSILHLALRRAVEIHDLPRIEASAFDKRPQFSFADVLRAGRGAVEFFLRVPHTATSRKKNCPHDVHTLIDIQRQISKPIFIVPHILVLGARPHHKQHTTTDMIFGTRQEPGFIRMLTRIFLCHRSAKWEITEPLNLQTFMQEHAGTTDDTLARQVRWSLTKRINDLERTYYGPPFKSHKRLSFSTLRDKDLQDYISTIHAQTGTPVDTLQKKANRYYQEIAARFDIDFIRILDKLLSLVWNRIYDGLVWQASDINKLRQAGQKGPLIILPSHKSHMDYVVMSQILYWEGLMIPHIAAGANLSFFPLGAFFRRGGAYFIRRTFRGDPLYPQVVRSYVKRLLKESFTQEFFIEGGRSRTGKTLPPKLGLLSIVVDCLTKGKLSEAMFLPASISYEKLVEASEYRRELEGGEKAVESTSGLLSSAHVLRKRYGKVFVTFDEPISFIEFLKERGISDENISEKQKKDIVKSLGHRIVYGMNRCSVITPTALIAITILGAPRRTLSRAQLIWRIKKLINHIDATQIDSVRFSEDLKHSLRKPIKRALDLLLLDKVLFAEKAGKTTYYRVTENSALSLDYYKNNIIHLLAADAIIATAFTTLSGKNRRKKVRKTALQQYTQLLSQIFKYEFVYPVGVPFSTLFEHKLEHAVANQIITIDGDYVCLSESRDANLKLNFANRLMANFVDAYWICTQQLKSAMKDATSQKTLVLNLLESLREAHVNGSSDCPEIVSKSMPENALQLFADYGAVQWQNGAPALGDSPALAKLELAGRILQKAHYNR